MVCLSIEFDGNDLVLVVNLSYMVLVGKHGILNEFRSWRYIYLRGHLPNMLYYLKGSKNLLKSFWFLCLLMKFDYKVVILYIQSPSS